MNTSATWRILRGLYEYEWTWRILRGLYEYECDMENIEGPL